MFCFNNITLATKHNTFNQNLMTRVHTEIESVNYVFIRAKVLNILGYIYLRHYRTLRALFSFQATQLSGDLKVLTYLMNTSRNIQAMMSEGYSWMSGLFES